MTFFYNYESDRAESKQLAASAASLVPQAPVKLGLTAVVLHPRSALFSGVTDCLNQSFGGLSTLSSSHV